jgi:hypothetical protein
VVGYFSPDRTVEENMARSPNRVRLVRKYCWAVPDPDTVAFVATHVRGGLVDPIAGTGYWAYLLAQVGVDVVCYDLNPGAALLTNGWHGEDLYAEVCAKDCAEAAALHPDRTCSFRGRPWRDARARCWPETRHLHRRQPRR